MRYPGYTCNTYGGLFFCGQLWNWIWIRSGLSLFVYQFIEHSLFYRPNVNLLTKGRNSAVKTHETPFQDQRSKVEVQWHSGLYAVFANIYTCLNTKDPVRHINLSIWQIEVHLFAMFYIFVLQWQSLWHVHRTLIGLSKLALACSSAQLKYYKEKFI